VLPLVAAAVRSRSVIQLYLLKNSLVLFKYSLVTVVRVLSRYCVTPGANLRGTIDQHMTPKLQDLLGTLLRGQFSRYFARLQ
jgi:hypothetical protein